MTLDRFRLTGCGVFDMNEGRMLCVVIPRSVDASLAEAAMSEEWQLSLAEAASTAAWIQSNLNARSANDSC